MQLEHTNCSKINEYHKHILALFIAGARVLELLWLKQMKLPSTVVGVPLVTAIKQWGVTGSSRYQVMGGTVRN